MDHPSACEHVGLLARGLVGLWARGLVGLWAIGVVGSWGRGLVGSWARGHVGLFPRLKSYSRSNWDKDAEEPQTVLKQ